MKTDEAAATPQPLSGGVSRALRNLACEIGGHQPKLLPPQNMTGRCQRAGETPITMFLSAGPYYVPAPRNLKVFLIFLAFFRLKMCLLRLEWR